MTIQEAAQQVSNLGAEFETLARERIKDPTHRAMRVWGEQFAEEIVLLKAHLFTTFAFGLSDMAIQSAFADMRHRLQVSLDNCVADYEKSNTQDGEMRTYQPARFAAPASIRVKSVDRSGLSEKFQLTLVDGRWPDDQELYKWLGGRLGGRTENLSATVKKVFIPYD